MTDSASDISYADEQNYSISVIPFPITLGNQSYTSGCLPDWCSRCGEFRSESGWYSIYPKEGRKRQRLNVKL